MPRKWDIDGDNERLPEGVKRTGYYADTQTYTYEADDGSVYEGAPGQQYGPLTKTGESMQSRGTTSSSSPSQRTTSTSRGGTPSPRSGSPQTFSTILNNNNNNNKNNTPTITTSHPRRVASSAAAAAAARPHTPKSIPYHSTTPASSPVTTSSLATTTRGSSSFLRTHPTAKDAAKVLASDVKEYTREVAISVMLRMSKSIRKRTRAKRAKIEREWVMEVEEER